MGRSQKKLKKKEEKASDYSIGLLVSERRKDKGIRRRRKIG